MSGLGIQVDVKGLERLQDRINKLAKVNPRSLFDALGSEIESQTKRRLESEKESPDGEAWAELNPKYKARKAAKSSGGLLEFEGDLIDSVTAFVYIDGTGVEVGSNLEYAAIQQFGGEDVGRPGHPAREYLGFSDANLDDLENILDTWADDQLEAL